MTARDPRTVMTPGRSGWRDDLLGGVRLTLLAGLCLLLSPWLVGYQDGDAWWNPIAAGASILTLASVRIAMPEGTQPLGMVNAAIGAWVFVSGFWLASSDEAAWSLWILGAAVFALTAVALVSPSRSDADSAVG